MIALKKALISSEDQQIEGFLESLNSSISRCVRTVSVIPLHGIEQSFGLVQEAIELARLYEGSREAHIPLHKFEMSVQYTNGDSIRGVFAEKLEAVRFLESFL